MLGNYPFYFLGESQRLFLGNKNGLEFWKGFLDYLGVSYSETVYDMDEEYKKFSISSLERPMNRILHDELGVYNRKIHLPELYRIIRFRIPPMLYRGVVSYYVILLLIKYLNSPEGKDRVNEKSRKYLLELFDDYVATEAFSIMPYLGVFKTIREEDFEVFKKLLEDIGRRDLVPYVEETQRKSRGE